MIEVSGERWYAATTRGGVGDLAVMHLKRQGFEAYCPKMASHKMERAREVVRKIQLFPGYVFVRFDREVARWRSINGTIGCGHLLGQTSDALPLALPVGFVEELQGDEASGTLTCYSADLKVMKYCRGDQLKVRIGPWQDHIGGFSRYRKGSVLLLMTFFSQQVEIAFRPHEVAPASPKAA